MLLADIFRRSGRSLLTAKTRTSLTVLAIGVGAFALTLTLAATNGANRYATEIVKSNFNPSELIVAKDSALTDATDTDKPSEYDSSFSSVNFPAGGSRQFKLLDDNDISRLKEVANVDSVRPAISLSLQYVTRDGQRKYLATAQQYTSYKSPELLAGEIPSTINDGTIILPEGFLTSLGFTSASDAIGKTIRLGVKPQADAASLLSSLSSGSLPTQAQTTEENFTIAAVTKKPSTLVQPGAALYLYMNQTDITRLNDIATKGSDSFHKYASAYVSVKDGTDESKRLAVQKKIETLGYSAQSVADTQAIITQVIAILQGIVLVFGLIAVVASVFGVVNTMYISVLQRTREIGLMKALGMHKRDITKLFLFEAALLGFLGGLVGSGIATILGLILNPYISNWLSLGSVSLLEFSALQTVLLIGALTFIAILAGIFPARKASRLDPINALRTE